MSQPGSPSPLARRASRLGALAVTAILSLSCGDGGGPAPTPAAPATPPVLGLEIPRPERTGYVVGMVDRLPDALARSGESLLGTPGNVTWTSSNPDILEVLPNGRFLARGAGEAELIASREGQEARVTLSVTSPYERTGEPKLNGLEVAGYFALHEGIGVVEEAIVAYGVYDHDVFREVAASFSSQDPDIVTVDDNGSIRVNGPGRTTLTASYEGFSATTPVRVLTREEFRDGFRFPPGEETLCGLYRTTPTAYFTTFLVEGMSTPLLTYELCSDGGIRRVHDVRWDSTDREVIRAEPNGFLTGVSAGEAHIAPRPATSPPPTSAPVADDTGRPPMRVYPAPELTPQALTRRSYQDRPDDLEGPQIHVVYAVPEDAPDRALDLSGALEDSVAAIQDWIRQAIGYELNLDTHGGRLDVTFVRLLTGYGGADASWPDLLDGLERALELQDDKTYLVFAPAGNDLAGKAQGPVGAVFLERYSSQGWGAFLDELLPLETPFGLARTEITTLHEILHTFGAVPDCGANWMDGNHVSDSSTDVMWAAGTRAGRVHIDVDRDDYFGHGRDDCLDTADSPYWRQVATVTTDATNVSRTQGPKPPPVTMEERIRSLLHPDPTLRCGLPH